MPTARRRKATARTPALDITTASVEETQAWGERVGKVLTPGDVVALRGELGSGKTTFIQGVARGLGVNPDVVRSPTFVIMREYPGRIPLIHIDGYRLEGTPDAMWLDTELLFSPRKVTVIEWAERFEGVLPASTLELQLEHVSTNRRRLTFGGTGERAGMMVAALSTQATMGQETTKADATAGD